jgi:hypothetical protein
MNNKRVPYNGVSFDKTLDYKGTRQNVDITREGSKSSAGSLMRTTENVINMIVEGKVMASNSNTEIYI